MSSTSTPEQARHAHCLSPSNQLYFKRRLDAVLNGHCESPSRYCPTIRGHAARCDHTSQMCFSPRCMGSRSPSRANTPMLTPRQVASPLISISVTGLAPSPNINFKLLDDDVSVIEGLESWKADLLPVVSSINQALRSGVDLQPVSEVCVSGCYILHDRHGNAVGIFKPQDEEPRLPNNPKGYTTMESCEGVLQDSVLHAIPPGQAGIREVAAFLLDFANGGNASVPQSALTRLQHPSFHHSPSVSSVGSFDHLKMSMEASPMRVHSANVPKRHTAMGTALPEDGTQDCDKGMHKTSSCRTRSCSQLLMDEEFDSDCDGEDDPDLSCADSTDINRQYVLISSNCPRLVETTSPPVRSPSRKKAGKDAKEDKDDCGPAPSRPPKIPRPSDLHPAEWSPLLASSKDSLPTLEVPDSKTGAFQVYIDHLCTAEDMGPGKFSVVDVHAIALFDLLVMNLDRHAGNFLVVQNPRSSPGDYHSSVAAPASSSATSYRLRPIDHGFILPESIQPTTFEWMNWPQSRKEVSPAHKQFIAELDVEENAKLLQALGLSPGAIQTFRVAATVVKLCIASSVTPYAIGMLMRRPLNGEESILERVVHACEAAEEETPGCYFTCLVRKMNQLLERRTSDGAGDCIHFDGGWGPWDEDAS